MENSNKYYTPSIEEFYVGFECEIESSYGWQQGAYPEIFRADTLAGFTLDELGEHDTLKRYLDSIRVKYLDKEDIESLEWKYTGKSIDIWFEKEDSFDLGSWTAHKIILHYGLHDNRLHIYADDPGSGNYELFRGIIKNKSELIKLMKQLGI